MNERSPLPMNLCELSADQRELADCIGMESYVKLAKLYGGSSIYISKANAMDRQDRNNNIMQDFDKGMTYKELASKYRLTTVWIRSIIDGRN